MTTQTLATMAAEDRSTRPQRSAGWARRALVAFIAALTVLAGLPAPARADEPKPPPTERVIEWGETRVSWLLQLYRLNHPKVTSLVNLAAFEWESGGQTYGIVAPSVRRSNVPRTAEVDLYVKQPDNTWKFLKSDTLTTAKLAGVPGLTSKDTVEGAHAEKIARMYWRTPTRRSSKGRAPTGVPPRR